MRPRFKPLFAFINTLQATPRGRHIALLLLTGYAAVVLVMIVGISITLNIGHEITTLVSEKLGLPATHSVSINLELKRLIHLNVGIVIIAMLMGLVMVILITRNTLAMLKQVHQSNQQGEYLSAIAEQKTFELARANQELARTNQALIKTNKNLSNSLEKLNETQDQLVQNEKMASLGGLVAGISHEINTPIGIGVTAASHLLDTTNDFHQKFNAGDITKSEFKKFLDSSSEACNILLNNLQRAARLINSFKQVAVDQTSEDRRLFNLQHYLEEILLSLRPTLKKTNVQITLNCPAHIELYGYPGALSQIITNFIMNSLLHAYSETDAGQILIEITEEKPGLLLHYCDDGCGVEATILPRIFDPFFTTRRGSGGSGLGLHLVYNLVSRQFKGRIRAYANQPCGLCFDIHFPADLASL
jgi:signal transduction histidine kinase